MVACHLDSVEQIVRDRLHVNMSKNLVVVRFWSEKSNVQFTRLIRQNINPFISSCTGELLKCKASSKLCSFFGHSKSYRFKFQWMRCTI